MVWVGICVTGKTPLFFVDEGVKLTKRLIAMTTWRRGGSSDPSKWQQSTLQQDFAQWATQEWCTEPFSNFVTSAEWPLYSPDLNQVDYSIWSILEGRASKISHTKIWRLWSSLCSGGGTDCRRKSCGARPWIFGSVWCCVVKQKAASLKQIKCYSENKNFLFCPINFLVRNYMLPLFGVTLHENNYYWSGKQ